MDINIDTPVFEELKKSDKVKIRKQSERAFKEKKVNIKTPLRTKQRIKKGKRGR